MPFVPQAVLMLTMALFNGLIPAGFSTRSAAESGFRLTSCWEYPIAGSDVSIMDTDRSHVFLGYDGAKIQAISSNGKDMWTTELGGSIVSNIASSGTSLLVVTKTDAAEKLRSQIVLRSMSVETGVPGWTATLAGGAEHHIAVSSGVVIVASDVPGTITALELHSGKVLWTKQGPDTLTADPVFKGDNLMIGATGKQVLVMNRLNGAVVSRWEAPYAVTALSAETETLVLGDAHGNVASGPFADGKRIWRFKTGGRVTGLIQKADRVFVTSNDNFVYCLMAKDGAVNWKVRLAGRPFKTSVVSEIYGVIGAREDGPFIVDLSSGRILGRVTGLAEGQEILALTTMGSAITVLTRDTVKAFATGSCSQNETVP